MSDSIARETLGVDLRDIHKQFYGVKANEGVNFQLRPGEVHALLGENGAGKSTLCSILAGLYRPDAGEMVIDGEPVVFKSPKDALAAGIGMVYQHFRLVPNLTVAENLALGHHNLGVLVDQKDLQSDAAELGERYGLPVDATARIWQLSVGEQQRVEILKLLYRDARVLILDEPTAVLTPQESQALFSTMRQLTDEGRSVIFVSHKLHEVKQVSDRVSVMRQGQMVGEIDTADAEPRDLARMMVGRDLELPTREEDESTGEPVLVVRDLRVPGDRGLESVKGVSFEVRAGEVVGVAGVSGNGQRELAYGLVGLRRPTAGSVSLDSVDVTEANVLEHIRQGLAYVPQNRLGMGLSPGLTTEDNLGLKAFREAPYSKGRQLVPAAFKTRGKDLIAQYDIRGVVPGLPIRLLSGGNLQKALLAREVEMQPKILIARSPTRGLDVGATEAVRNSILRERQRGTGILLMSEDLDELLALSDRLIVLYEGEIVGELTARMATAERLGLLMAGQKDGGN
ncbi:MAG: ABC transporter ATP-binding protein [Acidimicrobiia bacterium]|nr:ABC transporter ATP-binding protein [Acidimicrobiia bacterium]NNL27759.1 ABC transporter ATP-binding protein [Acidimicrobiia bacterium]